MSRLEANYLYTFIHIYSYLWSVAIWAQATFAQDVIKLTETDTPLLSRYLSIPCLPLSLLLHLGKIHPAWTEAWEEHAPDIVRS